MHWNVLTTWDGSKKRMPNNIKMKNMAPTWFWRTQFWQFSLIRQKNLLNIQQLKNTFYSTGEQNLIQLELPGYLDPMFEQQTCQSRFPLLRLTEKICAPFSVSTCLSSCTPTNAMGIY